MPSGVQSSGSSAGEGTSEAADGPLTLENRGDHRKAEAPFTGITPNRRDRTVSNPTLETFCLENPLGMCRVHLKKQLWLMSITSYAAVMLLVKR